MTPRPRGSPRFPYTTLFRSAPAHGQTLGAQLRPAARFPVHVLGQVLRHRLPAGDPVGHARGIGEGRRGRRRPQRHRDLGLGRRIEPGRHGPLPSRREGLLDVLRGPHCEAPSAGSAAASGASWSPSSSSSGSVNITADSLDSLPVGLATTAAPPTYCSIVWSIFSGVASSSWNPKERNTSRPARVKWMSVLSKASSSTTSP